MNPHRGRILKALRFSIAIASPAVLGIGASQSNAADALKADFIAGIWAMDGGCAKHAAIEAGATRSIETVPETLTASGYESWEGGCAFKAIENNGDGKWTVKTSCHEGPDEWEDTEAWELDPGGTRLKVTIGDKSTEFMRCDAGKGN